MGRFCAEDILHVREELRGEMSGDDDGGAVWIGECVIMQKVVREAVKGLYGLEYLCELGA